MVYIVFLNWKYLGEGDTTFGGIVWRECLTASLALLSFAYAPPTSQSAPVVDASAIFVAGTPLLWYRCVESEATRLIDLRLNLWLNHAISSVWKLELNTGNVPWTIKSVVFVSLLFSISFDLRYPSKVELQAYPRVREWGKLYMLWLIDVAYSAEVGQNVF